MKWSHLPVEGGLYDQHPDLLEAWRYIFSERSKKEAEEQKKQEREGKAARGGKVAGRGRRR